MRRRVRRGVEDTPEFAIKPVPDEQYHADTDWQRYPWSTRLVESSSTVFQRESGFAG